MAEQTSRAQGTLAVIGGGKMGEAIVGDEVPIVEVTTASSDAVTSPTSTCPRNDAANCSTVCSAS